MSSLRPFRPFPLKAQLGRIEYEWETRHRILDLPSGRFYQPDPAHDLSVTLGDRVAANPVGPAAGPHTQLAANYVLAWLTGARVFECKTVQVLDELDIDRPCIDMEGEGYNVEWSQELSLDQSLQEYVTAWMMLDVVRRWQPLWPVIGRIPGPHVFDLSVGYDLEGIRSPSVDTFIRGMLDATPVIDELRPQLAGTFSVFQDHAFEPRLATAATLSTFHGCPPDEIEAIVLHLMDTYGLDVVVKLNPTLLGHADAQTILQDDLGYSDVRLDEAAFEADLSFERALELIPRLEEEARARGRRFGIKLSNTLVVENPGQFLPGDTAYLSGAPLHVLTMTLLDRLHRALPGVLDLGPAGGPVQVSWSAGLEPGNLAAAAGLGLRPLTACSILLKPGGYGHLSTMLKRLNQEMTSSAVTRLPDWVAHCHEVAVDAGHPDALAAYVTHLRTAEGSHPYSADKARRRLRSVDHDLEIFGCVACNVCVTVCPNDAVLHVRTPEDLSDRLADSWQYLILAELCNECGNCTTFCPERGEPWAVKPRLFLDPDHFAADAGPAFLIEPGPAGTSVSVSSGLTEHLPILRRLLDGEDGFPYEPEHLTGP